MSAGYTYTTISSDPGEPGRIDVSFHLDSRALIAVCGQEGERPQLSLSLGEVSVRFCPALGPASAEDARIARDLASKAAEYAAAVEQLAAANGPGTAATATSRCTSPGSGPSSTPRASWLDHETPPGASGT